MFPHVSRPHVGHLPDPQWVKTGLRALMVLALVAVAAVLVGPVVTTAASNTRNAAATGIAVDLGDGLANTCQMGTKPHRILPEDTVWTPLPLINPMGVKVGNFQVASCREHKRVLDPAEARTWFEQIKASELATANQMNEATAIKLADEINTLSLDESRL